MHIWGKMHCWSAPPNMQAWISRRWSVVLHSVWKQCLSALRFFASRSVWNDFNAICWTKRAYCCVSICFIFLPSANSWRAHKRHFTSSLLHVWPLLVLFWIHRSFRIVKSCHIATLHVITSCFLVRLEVFGLCYIHISFEPHQSLFGSGPRPIFCGLGLLVWCASGFGLQHSHLLKWTALTGQSHHSSF